MRNLFLTVFLPSKYHFMEHYTSSIQSEISSKVLKIEMKMSLKIFKADAVLEVCLLSQDMFHISHPWECHTLAKTKTSRSGLGSASCVRRVCSECTLEPALHFCSLFLEKAGFGVAACCLFFSSFLSGMYFNNVDDFVLHEIAPKYLLVIYHSKHILESVLGSVKQK